MLRRTVFFLLGVVALTAAATPALAGTGPSKGGSTTASSSISIASVDGLAMNTALSPAPKLGASVTFRTAASGLAGWEYPMVAMSCYQDVNGDGKIDTNLLGPDIVYSELSKPDATFTVGGYSSIWTLRGGGDATCRADLDAYGWKSGKQSVRVLAKTPNWVAAG
jgi:hypothetical protein